MRHPITALVVGAGQRALIYASYAQLHPDELQIVAVAEPDARRRHYTQQLYGLPSERCFRTAEEASSQPKLADVAINGTMDHEHVPTSLPLLEAGYDLLLEKPFAVSESEMWDLVRAVRRYGRRVIICHVLRFAAFYVAIRQRVLDGAIGDVISMLTTEHVTYHHTALSYVRGKWARSEPRLEPAAQKRGSEPRAGGGHASMLMSKCSHDLDLISWMKSGIRPRAVASFGSQFQFRPERTPEGAGTRCLVDCPIEPTCLYSARKHYIDRDDRRNFYVWDGFRGTEEPTLAQKIAALETDSPFGRCVWKSGTQVVDHQSVIVDFADGATATHVMVGGAVRPQRSIHLIGTRGEIQGVFQDNRFVVRRIEPWRDADGVGGDAEELVDLSIGDHASRSANQHGGGDLRLVEDFLRIVRGEAPSISTTSLDDSVTGHLIGFTADRAMAERRAIDLAVGTVADCGSPDEAYRRR